MNPTADIISTWRQLYLAMRRDNLLMPEWELRLHAARLMRVTMNVEKRSRANHNAKMYVVDHP